MNTKQQAASLLEEYRLCLRAHVETHPIDLQIEKYAISPTYFKLDVALKYGSDAEVEQAYEEMVSKYTRFKEKLTMMILTR